MISDLKMVAFWHHNLVWELSMPEDDYGFFKRDRKKYADAIISSPSQKKVVIAGPGTGKTFIYQTLLKKIKEMSEEEGLALTFIRNLVANLKRGLDGSARATTFHSFCRSVVQGFKNEEFEYFPLLFEVIEKDFGILSLGGGDKKDIERCFFGLKDARIIRSSVKIGDYYNASGHTDSVYRVIKYFKSHESRIPKYPLVVVDEYQDFNFLETSLVDLLSKKSPVLIVGDDDQALYAFKQASPNYIRQLTANPEYERFELPYCSRCPEVIVQAVAKIVAHGRNIERLDGRIEKPFKYFPPDKAEDSRRHPKIINVNCSVERKKCHYIGKFIGNEIKKIPSAYIRESIRLEEPTVLVIGPRQFLDGVKEELAPEFKFGDEKTIDTNELCLLDGYRLAAKKEKSCLGWRIIVHFDQCTNANRIIKKAISENRNLFELIPSRQYVAHHQNNLGIVKKILAKTDLLTKEQDAIEAALSLSLQEITAKLLEDDGDTKQSYEREADKPYVLCTSFEGAKGLAAQYVFIVGVNENHFPQKAPPSNRDIYRLIVAVTRTRKRCYMISCNNFAGEVLRPSVFKSWLKDELSEERYIDKSYITKYCEN
jgi:superfamily I DNA/RNA helicase